MVSVAEPSRASPRGGPHPQSHSALVVPASVFLRGPGKIFSKTPLVRCGKQEGPEERRGEKEKRDPEQS